ncbi:MAG: preprotein translocase subunit YajC [Planctomycetes bacterium]|nr:preprotein translocase subunit YajC [Planctomycetota bacterium]MCB9905263.1 preprotein translocase subunit YajC [Planctomycetota bacterium]
MQEIQLPLATLLFQVPEGSSLAKETTTTTTTTTEGGGEGGSTKTETPGFLGGNPLFMLVLMGAFFWFVLIGPERKRRKKQEALLSGLKKGDEVVTSAGLYGKVVQVQDQIVTLQVAEGVRMRFSLQAVQGLAPSSESDAKA